MRRYLFLLVLTMLILTMVGIVAMADTAKETTVAYKDLPQAHRELYERTVATARAEVHKRLPGNSKLQAKIRGDFSGYTDVKSDNSLRVEYRVSDSIVKVGEKIWFYVNMYCDYSPMVYTVSGLVFDKEFNQTGWVNGDGKSAMIDDTFNSVAYYYPTLEPGYVSFIFAITDGNGNQVSVVTSTVMVCEEDDPIFKNQSADINTDTEGNLGLMMSLDRATLSVGTEITAAVDMTTTADPVKYRGVWTLTDEAGNILDTSETTSEVNAQAEPARINFTYRPLKAGKLQFVINANDGEGNRIKTNTPVIDVADGYYFTARLNRISALTVGNSLTATYNIYGHECDKAGYYIGWECHDAQGNTVASHTEVVQERSGKVTYTPRVGQAVEFYVGATCEHIKGVYPETVTLALVGGLEGEVSLTKSSVKYGETIGVKYSFEGGKEPYQKVIVKGYSYDESKNRTFCFLEKTVTDGQGTGTVSGAPKLGDEVYFEVQLVEADGNTSTWKTGSAAFTGAPEVTDPKVTASLSAAKVTLGEKVTLTYKMSGGSGTINSSVPEASYISWYRLDGAVMYTERLSKINGTPSYTPDAVGTYYCQLTLTDGYHQQITWKSQNFSVVKALPGDADGNGRVDAKDALLIMQYDAGWSVQISMVNADVNGGGVTLSDAVAVLRGIVDGTLQ